MNLNKILDNEINPNSLAEFKFLTDDVDLNEINSMFTYLIAGDGIFMFQKSEFGISVDKFDEIPYKNRELNKIGSNFIFRPFHDKIDHVILDEILTCFKYMAKDKLEVVVLVYFDTLNNEFIWSIPNQLPTSGNVDYEYEDELNNSSRFIKHLEIHSHHSMQPSFSAGDDEDEKMKDFCFYSVVGKINENTSIFNLNSKTRIWTGRRFAEMDISDVFSIPDPRIITELDEDTRSHLDSLIKKSKENQKEKGQKKIDEFDKFGGVIPTCD